MEDIKQETKICVGAKYSIDEYKCAIEIAKTSNNNYASCYAIPISTPKAERKGHNGMHQSHISKK